VSGTKIFVLQLKDVIKTFVFAVLGLVLILLLIYLFVPRNKQEPAATGGTGSIYKPGSYSAEIILHNSPVDVSVTVSEDEILSVTMTSLAETQEVFYPLFKPVMDTLSKEIVEYQTTKLTPSSDYPITGQILLDAVQAALNKAKVTESLQEANGIAWQ
jgi:uncharacterized protein with FMN-binding domain